ncbi:MAG: sensor histidine kinase, partial [Stackebrandtia sp.]
MTDVRVPAGGDRWMRSINGRPPVFIGALFWCAMVLAAVAIASDLGMVEIGKPDASPWMSYCAIVGMSGATALWPMLRWTGEEPRSRRLLSVGFAVFITLQLGVGGWVSFMLMALVVVHISIVFGNVGGYVFTVVVVVEGFAMSYSYRDDLAIAVTESVVSAVFALWAIAVARVLLSQHRHADATRRLLAEQTAAHTELRRYAERVRELTISQERARMSREMHDSVGHYLTVIGLGLRNARRYQETGRGDAWAEVAQAEQLTAEALAETRRWVKA